MQKNNILWHVRLSTLFVIVISIFASGCSQSLSKDKAGEILSKSENFTTQFQYDLPVGLISEPNMELIKGLSWEDYIKAWDSLESLGYIRAEEKIITENIFTRYRAVKISLRELGKTSFPIFKDNFYKIDLGKFILQDVTGVSKAEDGTTFVQYNYRFQPVSPMAEAVLKISKLNNVHVDQIYRAEVSMKKLDDGWRIISEPKIIDSKDAESIASTKKISQPTASPKKPEMPKLPEGADGYFISDGKEIIQLKPTPLAERLKSVPLSDFPVVNNDWPKILIKSNNVALDKLKLTAMLAGLGFKTNPTNEGSVLVIASVKQGSPAEKMGLKIADKILAVDGEKGFTIEDIRGGVGTQVNLTVVRGTETLELSGIRESGLGENDDWLFDSIRSSYDLVSQEGYAIVGSEDPLREGPYCLYSGGPDKLFCFVVGNKNHPIDYKKYEKIETDRVEQVKIENKKDAERIDHEQKDKAEKIATISQKMYGKWVGTYNCGYDSTGLSLKISPSNGGNSSEINAIFDFYPIKPTKRSKSGSFSMIGEVSESGDFNLNPKAWINKPSGMNMVAIDGKMSEGSDKFIGQIRGCSKISLNKE